MERENTSEIYISPTADHFEQWQEALADPELLARFNELVESTRQHVDATEYPWVEDRTNVAARWQHAANMLGNHARSHGHPIFTHGRGWVDEARVAEVLEPVKYRSFDASFVEKALILTHSLAVVQGQSKYTGLSVSINLLNNVRDNQEPELVEHFTSSIDIRDMSEPTETVIGDMTVEDFGALSEDARKELFERLHNLLFKGEYFGDRLGWLNTPQQSRYMQEKYKLQDYSKLIKFGTTDDKEIEGIRDTRMAEEIARLRNERPDFGKVPDNFEELPDKVKECIGWMFEYFDEMRERYEVIGIDTYSMGNMGFDTADLQALKEAGILTNEQSYPSPDGMIWSYLLAAPYYELWVARHYPVESETKS